MKMVDELLETRDHVSRIVGDENEFRQAMHRIDDIVADTTRSAEERVNAKSLGLALKTMKSGKERGPLGILEGLLSGVDESLKFREHPAAQQARATLGFGDSVFFGDTDDNVTIITEAKVIRVNEEIICCAGRDGLVHFIPHESAFRSLAECVS